MTIATDTAPQRPGSDALTGTRAALDSAIAAIPGLMQRCARPARSADPDIIPVPHAYYAPCHSGPFQMQFYWDTFFVNRVLLSLGRVREARNAVENLTHLLSVYGRVPNCNHRAFVNRSQPPMLALMVDEIHRIDPDRAWLASVFTSLTAEYSFWEHERSLLPGLNRYGHNAWVSELLEFSDILSCRLGLSFENDSERVRIASHYMAEAESGWDFNPRFDGRCADFAPVDLNALLYRCELLMASFAAQLGLAEEHKRFERAAHARKRTLDTLFWDSKLGTYRDWDSRNRTHSPVESLASFFPLWCGAASEYQAQGVVARLGMFEEHWGLSACAAGPRSTRYQWDHPNGWAPLHLIAVEGMMSYGYREQATRIARRFIDMVARCYAETGDFWEKYNVVSGTLDVSDEYPMPPLAGWTAAAVLALSPLAFSID